MANNVTYKSDASTTVATISTFDAGVQVECISLGGNATASVAAGTTADTVIKASKGLLCRVLVTTIGTNPMQVFDNASGGSGTIVGVVAGNAPAGSVYEFHMPCANGITVKGNAANPAVTVSFV